ncbi:MAG: hypothetical protein PUP46_08395 [Endozoicomonas sp. (ex Botrylloides leachii)]|nr:hypothetical protein [Endozoicomonas sp. (ex Botrylloides leachii)]
MMMFWAIAFLLVLFALAFVILPLLKNNNKQESNNSNQSRLNIKLAMLLAALVPIVVLTLYSQLGAQTELTMTSRLHQPNSTPAQRTQAMEQWLQQHPEDTNVLYVLASEHISAQQFDKALNIYRRLYQLTGKHAHISAQLAQILFLTENQKVTDEVRRLYQESLVLDANNNTALGLKGIDAFEQTQYAEAVDAWQRAIQNEQDPYTRQALASGIIEAKRMLQKKPESIQ